MNLAGWIVMLVSVGTVTLLMAWCIYKVVATPGESDHLRGIKPQDKDRS